MAEKYKDLIPKPELLLTLQNVTDIMTIEEWNATFDGHTQMDAEDGKEGPFDIDIRMDMAHPQSYSCIIIKPRLCLFLFCRNF